MGTLGVLSPHLAFPSRPGGVGILGAHLLVPTGMGAGQVLTPSHPLLLPWDTCVQLVLLLLLFLLLVLKKGPEGCRSEGDMVPQGSFIANYGPHMCQDPGWGMKQQKGNGPTEQLSVLVWIAGSLEEEAWLKPPPPAPGPGEPAVFCQEAPAVSNILYKLHVQAAGANGRTTDQAYKLPWAYNSID